MTGFGRIIEDLNGAGVSPVPEGGIAADRTIHLSTPHGELDLPSEAAAGLAFVDLLRRSEARRVDGVEASICSLADLVAMKRSVGRERDLVDLVDLESAHGELPDSRSSGA